ncbi:MAG TPA: HD domain-containing protein [Oscillospiraceae bacterium]|nr:HD domain-containing protein [Oscillospiraceae bacterium]HNY00698.1 HD domain-containing protein [Oscillospiraceae bacterium]HPS75648.1 HD domain-containing protein [Oscillospiraceae bacterium]
MITFEQIRQNSDINTYIQKADESLVALGYTEHSFAHVGMVAEGCGYILTTLGYPEREVELARIAAYLHDIGNLVNRIDHSQSGAVMAFRILNDLGMAPEEIAEIVAAIGNHDEGTGTPVSPISAALILADKSDVRRSRVRNPDTSKFDIHDRVNYSVKKAELKINENHTLIKLKLSVDTRYGSVMDYFEIFMDRMLLCRKAAEKLGLQFKLMINEQQLM